MILKGKSRKGARSLAAHLGNAETNERVQLLESRGTLATDLSGALVEMEAYAVGTRAQKALYHAALSPEPPHRLTPEQRLLAVDALEAELGLNGHARVIVLHEKLGREHLHVVWSRIDLKNMRSVSDSHNYRRHEKVARELEREFGHRRVQGAHHEREGVQRPDRTPSRAELRQQERTGITGKQVKTEVTEILRGCDGPDAFKAGLENAGYLLALGDRRDFVVIDRAGGIHSLARRIEGMKAAELRAFMAPLDTSLLMTTAQAVDAQRDRAQARGVAATLTPAMEQPVSKEPITPEGELERRTRKAGTKEERLEAAFARGDDYVSQSRAAMQAHQLNQAKLNKQGGLDSLWDRIEEGERIRRGQYSAVKHKEAESNAASQRLDRLLDGLEERPERSHLADDTPDIQQPAPDIGHSRSR